MHSSQKNPEVESENTIRQVLVKTGTTLLIAGPASLELVEGKANIFASPLSKNRRITIREGKQLPVEASENSTFNCHISNAGRFSEVAGSTIPSSWMEIAQTVLEVPKSRIVVIGNVDSGKSAFCTMLANLAVNSGIGIAVLDADLGQSDIGPPSTIGLGRASTHVLTLSEVPPDLLYFVGYISPAPVTDKVLYGIGQLLNHTKGPDSVVMNTDGWVVDDEAIVYKKRLIDSVKPDFVVGIGEANQVNPILELTKCTSFQISSPNRILKRSKEQRREIREFGYRKYLANAKVTRVDVVRSQISYSDGRAIKPEDINPSLVNSLVGVLDENGWLIGIGVISQVDLQGGLKVFSPVPHRFFKIEVGAVKLNEQGTELSYLNERN